MLNKLQAECGNELMFACLWQCALTVPQVRTIVFSIHVLTWHFLGAFAGASLRTVEVRSQQASG